RTSARLGFEAQQRYFLAEAGLSDKARQRADLADAERYLGTALNGLAAEDPLRAEVCFALGSVLITEHERRCTKPCPALDELRRIVALLGAAGSQQNAPMAQ